MRLEEGDRETKAVLVTQVKTFWSSRKMFLRSCYNDMSWLLKQIITSKATAQPKPNSSSGSVNFSVALLKWDETKTKLSRYCNWWVWVRVVIVKWVVAMIIVVWLGMVEEYLGIKSLFVSGCTHVLREFEGTVTLLTLAPSTCSSSPTSHFLWRFCCKILFRQCFND